MNVELCATPEGEPYKVLTLPGVWEGRTLEDEAVASIALGERSSSTTGLEMVSDRWAPFMRFYLKPDNALWVNADPDPAHVLVTLTAW
jgi:hypothetical protein